MNQRLKTTLLVFFALTTLGTGILAWQQYRMLQSFRGDSSTTDDYASLRKKLADAEHRAHALQNDLDALKSKGTDTASDEPSTPPNEGDGPGPRGGRFRGPDGFRELMNDPKVVALMTAREKQMLDSRYADLFKSLVQSGKLTPEQIEAFKNLLVERQNTLRDVRMSARDQGITDRTQIDALVKSTQAELDAQMQSTLGPAAYSEFQAYEKTAPQRNFVSQFAQSLSYTSAPLSDAQTQQLVDLLASASTGNTSRRQGGFGGGGPGGMFGGGGSSVTVTDATLTAAATVLNPSQMAALTQIKAQQDAQDQLRQSMRAARQATTGATTTSTSTTGTSTVKTAK